MRKLSKEIMMIKRRFPDRQVTWNIYRECGYSFFRIYIKDFYRIPLEINEEVIIDGHKIWSYKGGTNGVIEILLTSYR